MRSLAPYTHVTLRRSRRGRGHNSTSAPLSRVVNTNAKRLHLRLRLRLCLRRQPSSQPTGIPSAITILFILQPFTDYSVGPNRVISSEPA